MSFREINFFQYESSYQREDDEIENITDETNDVTNERSDLKVLQCWRFGASIGGVSLIDDQIDPLNMTQEQINEQLALLALDDIED